MQSIEQWFRCIIRNNQQLVLEGLDVYAGQRDNTGTTGLMIAAKCGNLLATQLLAPYEFEIVNSMNQTALDVAAANKQYDVLNYLKQAEVPGSPAYIRIHAQKWFQAAREGEIQLVQKNFPFFIKCQNFSKQFNGQTALMQAAQTNQLQIMHLLIEQEAKMVTKRGKTALMLACEAQNIDAAKMLYNYEVGICDDFRWNALMYAVDCSFVEGIKMLCQNTTELKQKNVFNMNAFDIAKQRGMFEIIDILKNQLNGDKLV